ncbi:porin [Methylobacterium brachythecii]|uniref:Porin n=1 Tax=Methylobacterium brachythecii TaxID=1176177 RepID=A0A7W6F7R0_9HYPH|nr:porin [Methylobacterium brachythecii]MBB3903351.1 hypothetical protein [Methylobacterium brachythecii]GLS45432.1 hypothetical protein GCM10007884_34220 [Methylobacterium brachythecii]
MSGDLWPCSARRQTALVLGVEVRSVFAGTRAMYRLVRLCPLLLFLAAAPATAFERAPLPSEAPMQKCPEQGPGFARIPGTSTCIRLSGRVAAGADVATDTRTYSTGTGSGRFAIDTRTDTAVGPMRSFVRIDAGRR